MMAAIKSCGQCVATVRLVQRGRRENSRDTIIQGGVTAGRIDDDRTNDTRAGGQSSR
jgi:hypothetical protein